MAKNKKIFTTTAKFNEYLNGGQLTADDICIIQDVKKVYINGIYLDGNETNLSDYLTADEIAEVYATKASLKTVATSGSYNDLSDKPTIPSAVTESTVSGWGFTKNTGTYSKPSGGIPKTDLASAVQTSLGKADTALQSHQDISGKQDKLVSGTNIKTINGESILGSGDINVKTGLSIERHGEDETTLTLTPGVLHIWDEVEKLNLTVDVEGDGEYMFQFKSGKNAASLSISDGIKWSDDFIIDSYMIYRVTISCGLGEVIRWVDFPNYFRFEPLESGTVALSDTEVSEYLEYSISGGQWKDWDGTTDNPINLNRGDILYIRGNAPGFSRNIYDDYTYFVLDGDMRAAGNIMSLLYGDDFEGAKEITYNGCFAHMFDGCTSLVTAPELPATTLVYRCYFMMFWGCTSLNYVKILATDIRANECLSSWLSNVASAGTFVKRSEMTSLPSGTSGIPSGWTVVDV